MAEGPGRPGWHDDVIAERLITDREFQARVYDASLSNQSWELVMTAVEIRIERPKDPEEAALVVDTKRLDNVLPAIEDIEARQGQQGGDVGSGIVRSILDAIGLGGTSGDAHRDEAERLATEYVREFQRTLEERGRWESICQQAAEEAA